MSKRSLQHPPINGLFWDPFWDKFGVIFGVCFRNDFWHRFGTVLGCFGSRLGYKFEPKKVRTYKSHGFQKRAFRPHETAVLDVQGSQSRSRKSEKRDRRNDVVLYSSLVECWSFLGRILGPKIDQQSIKKSSNSAVGCGRRF